jgi:hypothetical protein
MRNMLSSWRRPLQASAKRELLKPPTFDSALNRLLYKGIRRFIWLQFKLQCPVSPLHRVRSWTAPGRCPRCGLHLERNAVPYRIWE